MVAAILMDDYQDCKGSSAAQLCIRSRVPSDPDPIWVRSGSDFVPIMIRFCSDHDPILVRSGTDFGSIRNRF